MRQRGFTLIEMAIVLVIMGVLTAVLVPTIVNVVKREKISQGKIGLNSVRDQIIGYAIDIEKLPDDQDGTPYRGIVDLSSPVDAWNKPFYYRANSYISENDPEMTAASICGVKSTDAGVPDNLKVSTQGGTEVPGVAFVTVSSGPDGTLDTTLTATPVDIASSATGDDLVEYVTLTHLKALLNCGSAADAPPEGGGGIGGTPQVTFADNISSFSNPTNNDFKGDGIITDPSSKTITLKLSWGDTSSCLWYEGDAVGGDCTSGNCDFNSSIMVYFKFKSQSNIWDDIGWNDNGGFTFALISSEDTTGYLPCGSEHSDDMGYAGHRSGTDEIEPPKIAVEFDFSPSGNNKGEFADHWYTDIRRHYGIVYWGNTNSDNDDNAHGDTGDSDGGANPAFLTTQDNVGYAATNAIYKFDGNPSTTNNNIPDNWFTDTHEYETRIHFTKNGNEVNATAWLRRDSIAPDFADMTTAYSSDGDYKIAWSKTFPAATIAKLARVRFGWTMAMAAEAGEIEISDFALRFD